jgi:high-affinity nickel-transport protein
LLQALGHGLGLSGRPWSWLAALDFTTLGYAVLGLFVLTWISALALWRWRRIEQRWRPGAAPAAAGNGPDPSAGLTA